MQNRHTVILLDNGSSRAQSTLSLRRVASALAERTGDAVHPVSLMHANKVPARDLGGHTAATFEPFIRAQAAAGQRDFVVLPLFFGPSRALTDFIPQTVASLGEDIGPLNVRVADVLCPLPTGEPRLVQLMLDNILQCSPDRDTPPRQVVLVDHGSPIPEVTAVRRHLAAALSQRLGPKVRLEEAVMERRAGAEYDFNGDLLESKLRTLAEENTGTTVILSMLFMFPGRHAGPEGDVEQILRSVERDHPGLRVRQTTLVGDHPGLGDILVERLETALSHS